MRSNLRTTILAAIVLATAHVAGAQSATLIRNARVFDGQRVVEREDVLIRGSRITQVGRSLALPSGAQVVDAAGMTLLPGFIDAHTHATSAFTSKQALAFGVTTEIDLLCQPSVCKPLHDEQDRAPVTDRADVLSALISVTAPGGHGTEYFPVPALSRADSAQAFVDARIAEGAKWIKVIYTTGSPSRPIPTLDIATIRAVIVAAHRRDKLVVVHIDALSTAREVIEAGADGLAHSFVDRDPDPDFGRFMAAHHAFMIPTLSVRMGGVDSAFYLRPVSDSALLPYLTPTARKSITDGVRWRPAVYGAAEAAIRQMRDAGALVLAGTDAPNPGTSHGASIHGEMVLLARAGLTPIEGLASATSAPASAFRLTDRGRIAAGLRADLVLVRGDPTRDIRATRNIVAIWKLGARFDRAAFARDANPASRSSDTGTVIITGRVAAARTDTPVAGANVFLVETLEGALTMPDGRFRIATHERGTVTLRVRRIGFAPAECAISVTDSGTVVNVTLERQAPTLTPMTIVASTYSASDERGATLKARDVVAIPGANADISRAIQTMPGVQSVDEGNALFVRGGDQIETRYLVNDVPLGVATRYQNASGTFAGTVNPFLLDKTVFMSGGFGARFGNALSGIVSLTTASRPEHTGGTVSAGLGALSSQLDVALPERTGLRLTGNRFQSSLMIHLNGSTQRYEPVPNGHDLSGSAHWDYGEAGKVKLFVINQGNQAGTAVDDASFTGAYYTDVRSTLGVLSWSDLRGGWRLASSVSRSQIATSEIAGAFDLLRTSFGSFGTVRTERDMGAIVFRTGAEWQRADAGFFGSIPKQQYDRAPGARTTTGDSRGRSERSALFAEADWRPIDPFRLSAGLRGERFTLTDHCLLDPRFSTTWRLSDAVTFIGAVGVYHQFPEMLAYDPVFGARGLAPMRATHAITGVHVGTDARGVRLEVYDKQYSDLAQLDVLNRFVGGGVGRARGLDIMARDSLPFGFDGRVTLSYVHSRRTDPTTGIMSPAAFDVPYSFTAIARRPLGRRWTAGATVHAATGRPFTDVASAALDSLRHIWVPVYSTPMAQRMPATFRTDVQLTRVERFSQRRTWITYISVNNLFDRDNLYTYRYSADYSRRIAVRSLFKRSFYVGMSLVQ